MNMNRRDFFKGAAAVGGLATLVGLAGCGPRGNQELGNTGNDAPAPVDIVPSSTEECDICVVGAGVSGLSAAVQAAELGASVIAVEASDTPGGGGRMGVEGSFGLGSTMFKESGIQVDRIDILRSEMTMAQNRPNAQLWNDLMDQAGENIDWLIEQGVEFSGEIDDYHGGKFPVFHWYKNGRCADGYVPPMTARAEALGVQFMLKTWAKHLIKDDQGKVTGVFVQPDDSDDWIQINAKAVILASGGFGSNPEIVAKIGYEEDRIDHMFEFAKGDGYLMALEAGAKDALSNCCDQIAPMISALPKGQSNMLLGIDPTIPWVNDECERFYDEDIVVECMSYSNPPKWNQKDYFMIWDQGILDNFTSWGVDGVDIPAEIQKAIQTDNGVLYASDSWEELAGKFNLDPAALKATVDEYNAMCRAGSDDLFGKDPQYLKELATPPFYMARPYWVVFCVVGGISTNRHSQVITENLVPIEGLYAIGNDGCMLYRNIYTIDTPGTCSGFGIASGRASAKHAFENYVSA